MAGTLYSPCIPPQKMPNGSKTACVQTEKRNAFIALVDKRIKGRFLRFFCETQSVSSVNGRALPQQNSVMFLCASMEFLRSLDQNLSEKFPQGT